MLPSTCPQEPCRNAEMKRVTSGQPPEVAEAAGLNRAVGRRAKLPTSHSPVLPGLPISQEEDCAS